MSDERSMMVVVCARDEETAALPACLDALAAAGVDAPRVVRARRGHGFAQARNAALAHCSDDVIAFVEDDVVVDPEWLTALRAAWSDADERLGCVGGPVGALIVGQRPPWFSDALLPGFGVVDPGLPGGPVDAQLRTFPGGNVSFDAAALRGIGGFWPARGQTRARDWFSEEHHAQRELARAGWRARYDPELRAARRIDASTIRARQVIAARARTGALEQLIGTRRDLPAARRALARRSAGALVAALRGQRALAVDRAARAAAEAGALVPGRLAGAELEPVATSTPFRHTVPPAAHAARRRRTREAPVPLVLCYHRIGTPGPDPLGLSVSSAHIASQLAALAAVRTLVPLAAILGPGTPPDAVAITFDDGYADVLHEALPELERHRAPATVFVTTGHVDSGRGFWWDELARLLSASGGSDPLRVSCAGELRAWSPQSPEQRDATRRHLHAWLQPHAPEDIEQALRTIREWTGADAEPKPPAAAMRPLTPDELGTLAGSPLITIGAHTRSHPSLRFASPERRRVELNGARADLAAWLGATPDQIAYPFGVPGVDVDDSVARDAREAGHRIGVVLGPRPGPLDPLLLPRVVVPDVPGDALLELLAAQP